ncbi:MAG: biopolymer transporter ExbD [Granulosicoccus sp.]
MKSFDSINVIPFVDILLVLLAMVLTTATFVTTGDLEITLPIASGSESAPNDSLVEIGIDADGKLYFDGIVHTLVELEFRLADVSPNTRINIKVDSDIEFQRFVTVVDLMKRLSLDKVSIITRQSG